MNVLTSLFVAQTLAQTVQAPVLAFPEAGLDDPTAYEGYATRFFRDTHRNAFQIYLDNRSGRVVHVWADAANESLAFTVRDGAGHVAPLDWGGPGAASAAEGPRRSMRHRLVSVAAELQIGWYLLGSMRQERDFQYLEWHRRPFGDPPFVLGELTGLIASLERLPIAERKRHLALLDARDLAALRSRLEPRVALTQDGAAWRLLVEHTSLDGRSHLTLELRGDARTAAATFSDDRLFLRAHAGGPIELDVTVATDADALTPLRRERLFNEAFEDYYAQLRRRADSLHERSAPDATASNRWLDAFRRFERQVRGLELLSYEEKLLASMPNYATYFGRDQMLSALMLEPIVAADVQEHVIASVLRKLSLSGQVSHEEALGGQAIRENAVEYSARIRAWEEVTATDPEAAAQHLAEARQVLERLQAVRENYRMIDDDFQLPVLVDRYLARADVPAARKRRFLSEEDPGGAPRLDALVRNLAYVAELSRPYAVQAGAANLVEFLHRDDQGWLPGSWRDSRVGYGNGRFAMDVNVVWVPKALEAAGRILQAIDGLGLSVEDALARAPVDGAALDLYLLDTAALSAAIETWRGARRHFEIRLTPDSIRQRVDALMASLPGPERDYWQQYRRAENPAGRPLSFLALSLDSAGQPIPALNTDPAIDLFLAAHTNEVLAGRALPAAVLEPLDAILRPYPVGLFVEGLGPLVVNDAYASAELQQHFRDDTYHSPRVVWGREVNLLLLGLARQIEAAYDGSGRRRDESEDFREYVAALRRGLERTRAAVEASGLRHNELWSYRIEGGTLRPVRYGTSSDIQLWNVTDLAVRFRIDRLPPR